VVSRPRWGKTPVLVKRPGHVPASLEVFVNFFKAGARVLEIGGGMAPSYHPNLDVRPGPGVDVVHDLSKPLPFEWGSFDGVFSKYSLEHISWRGVPGVLKEVFRVLAPGGTAVFVVPNTVAQMHWALKQPADSMDKVAQCLFGDLDYPENSHKAAFSPEYAVKVLNEAGFKSVATQPHGELGTDMIVIAIKEEANVNSNIQTKETTAADWSLEERKEAYNFKYFDGGRGAVGGYAREGYWDYPVHWNTFGHVMLRNPESVLEIGCARGYVLKRIEDAGVRAAGIEVSEHCYQTRVTEAVRVFDVTQTPWPFADKEFDLSFSMAVLEHIPEQHMAEVAAEIKRVSKRGLHGVDFGDHDDGFDKTHCLFRDAAWWTALLGPGQEVFEKDVLEKDPGIQASKTIFPAEPAAKANLGSFTVMFHHGWVNVDVKDLSEFASKHRYFFKQADLSQGVPFPDGHLELVNVSHFLEHLPYSGGEKFLKDLYRSMKPGALVRISVPDTKGLAAKYVAGKISEFDELGNEAGAGDSVKFYELLAGGHLAFYDEESLVKAVKWAGFKLVESRKFRESRSREILKETRDMFPGVSIFVEAVK
jgi:predicted SAM-dependent methyltransferase